MSQLGPDQVLLQAADQTGSEYDLALAVGDRVRLFDRVNASYPDKGRGIIGNNGSVLEVREIGSRGLVLRNVHGTEGTVRWDTLRDPASGRIRLTYGDVLSIDATQGATSTEHINAMPAGTRTVNGFKGYVAESRHRQTTWLIVSDGAERQEVAGRRPLGDGRPLWEQDVWANMVRNLSRQPEKASALAFLDKARRIHRSAARGLQKGLQPAEQRQHEGRERTALHTSLAEGRNRVRVRTVAECLDRTTGARISAVGRLAESRGAVRESLIRGLRKARPALGRTFARLTSHRPQHLRP